MGCDSHDCTTAEADVSVFVVVLAECEEVKSVARCVYSFIDE